MPIPSHRTPPPHRVSHRVLKNQQGQVFRDLPLHGTVEVHNRSEVDGMLLSPQAYATLQQQAAEGARLQAALPLLLAAAKTEIMIPSETFETLGLNATYDWQALDGLLDTIAVSTTHDDEGNPLPDTAGLALTPMFFDEQDEELRVDE